MAWQYVRLIWRRRAVKRQIDEELEFHLAMRQADNVRDGMAPEFGLRTLRTNPGYTAVAVLTLALGVGGNTSMFSTLKRFCDCSLPYPEPERLVRVSQATPAGDPYFLQACGDFLDERECAFHGGSRVNLACPGSPAEGLGVQYVTADFFPALGLVPALGRSSNAEEEQPGRDDLAILSQDSWARRFNRDPQIVGRTLRLDGKPTTVVGVVPMEDNMLLFEGRVDVLRPLGESLVSAVAAGRGLGPAIGIGRQLLAGTPIRFRPLQPAGPRYSAGPGGRRLRFSHHARKTFRQECLTFLRKFEIAHDERFVFKSLDEEQLR